MNDLYVPKRERLELKGADHRSATAEDGTTRPEPPDGWFRDKAYGGRMFHLFRHRSSPYVGTPAHYTACDYTGGPSSEWGKTRTGRVASWGDCPQCWARVQARAAGGDA